MTNEAITADIDRLRSGGQDSLADEFMRHRPRLRRMVVARLDRRLSGRVDASDIMQETFIEASRRLDEYLAKPTMPFFLWLRFLTGQHVLTTHRRHLKAKKRDARQEQHLPERPRADSAALSWQLSASITSPSKAAAREETHLLLRKIVDNLDELDREVLSLRHFEQLDNRETATELNISPAAASKRYIRALERLKKAVVDSPRLSPDSNNE